MHIWPRMVDTVVHQDIKIYPLITLMSSSVNLKLGTSLLATSVCLVSSLGKVSDRQP